ncbi:MAG: lamin tail domain-containing protein, partial [Verrucomicrobiales bacterium]|nr:lamin tail domain-containing protein [Verrucomicrobiales bacterium]
MVNEHKYDAGLWKRGWFYLMGCLSGFVLCGLGVAEEPVISEFLAANVSGLRDSDSEASDWIEIFNPSSSPVMLTGWCLTDDAGDLTKWRLPEVEVAGGGYLVVFASGKDRRDPGEELHTNFSLGRDGEYLALVRPDGVVASDFGEGYPVQLGDRSYGIEMNVRKRELVAADAAGRLRVPLDAGEDAGWRSAGFDDSEWRVVTLGVGYDRGEGEPP